MRASSPELIQRYPEDELPVVAVPDEREDKMRSLVSMKHYLVTLRTSMVNRLHALYVQAGMTFVKKSDLASSAARLRMAARLDGYLARFAAAIERELSVTEQEIAALDQELRTMVAEHELAPYVLSVPGVGPGVAAAFLAYVGDGKRFSSPAQVANYIGLVPRLDCSGETRSAVALARRMVGLMWILVTRHEYYADASKEMLESKFKRYGLKFEGWESNVA